jgi:hypothetical protein
LQPGGSRRVKGENGCEMGEGVMGIYRARKQWTSGPKGVRLRAIHQRSKGCFLRPCIIQRLIQKVAYIHLLFTEYGILSISVCPVVPADVHTKIQERTSDGLSGCLY